MAKKKAAAKKKVTKRSAVKKRAVKKTGKRSTKKATAKKTGTKKGSTRTKSTRKKATKKSTAKKTAASGKTGTKPKSATAISDFRRFEFVDGKSSKFWEIKQNGSEFTVRYGRIGTDGQAPKTKDMGTPEKAAAEVEKLIRAKTGKGYAETAGDVGTTGVSKKASRKKAAKKKVKISTQKRGNASAEISRDNDVVLTKEIAEQFLGSPSSVDLEQYTAIEDAAAKILSKYKWESYDSPYIKDSLDLNGLTSLSNAAAESLRKYKGLLELNDLTSLSDAAAESLSRHRGSLELSGLTSLSDAAAESLSKHRGDLSLSEVRKLSDTAVQNLGNYNLNLGLTTLSNAQAESLGKRNGRNLWLSLRNLAALSDAAAESLGKFRGECLSLDGLKKLSDAAAESLGKSRANNLQLDDLRSLSEPAAQGLSKYKGDLDLKGLKTLSVAAAEALSQHKGWLWLDDSCIQGLSEQAVVAISKHPQIVPRWLSAATKAKLRKAQKKSLIQTKSIAFKNILAAKKAGADLLRSTWNGYGDDGFFEHIFYKQRRVLKLSMDPHDEVVQILEENECAYSENNCGSVGLMELNLDSGKATWTSEAGEFAEVHRLAEFLVECQRSEITSVNAQLLIKLGDDEDAVLQMEEPYLEIDEIGVSKITTTPNCKMSTIDIKALLEKIEQIESLEDHLLSKILLSCGQKVTFSADVPKRLFCFAGNRKKVVAKVPKAALKATRFQVSLED